jgi:hypothetical protein
MSARKLTRVEVLARVKASALSVKSASVLLHVSYRQAPGLLAGVPMPSGSVTSRLTTVFGVVPSHPRAVERGTPRSVAMVTSPVR